MEQATGHQGPMTAWTPRGSANVWEGGELTRMSFDLPEISQFMPLG